MRQAAGWIIIFVMVSAGCERGGYPTVDRESLIPPDVAKMQPGNDSFTPILHSGQYHRPVPMPYPVSTAGAEDSPYILPGGRTLYFFFTPDVRVPAEEQITDQVTGLYVCTRNGNEWSRPERVWLNHPGVLSLDGAACVQGDLMWFASARVGYTGVNMFTARYSNGRWTRWRYAGDRLNKQYRIGEVHAMRDGNTLYFHSDRPGGAGEVDIWVTRKQGGQWQEPEHIPAVNTAVTEGWPFVTHDGGELWFTRWHMGSPAIFRSRKDGDSWQAPELILSRFAAEPTLDSAGNLYFVHHYFRDGQMIEADLYVAYRK